MNDESKCFFDKKGVKRTTIPLELNESEIKKRENSDSEMIIYGYYPMMISAQCLKKTCERCEKKTDIVTLTDRYKSRFRTNTVCDFCYNVIYNSIPKKTWNKKSENQSDNREKTGVKRTA